MDRDRFLAVSTPRRTQQQTSSQRSAHRTPGSRTPFSRNRPVRHNILTPGRERRRSGILPARKTPRDDLRLLSRLLKRTSPRVPEQSLHPKRQSQSSLTSRSSILSGQFQDDDNDEEQPPQIASATYNDATRDDEEDDEQQLRHPPRVSVSGDEEGQEDMTAYSVEFLRRMTAESRLSLDRTRSSMDNVADDDNADDSTQFVIRLPQNEEIPLDDNQLEEYSGYEDDRENPINDYEDYEDDINQGSLQEEFVQRTEQRKSDTTTARYATLSAKPPPSKRPRTVKLEPALPKKLIKDLAKNFSSIPLSADACHALADATDLFFKQASSDLATYARHANRKTIDESDVLLLLKRQKQLTPKVTVFGLAHKYLPTELVAELRLPNVNSEKSIKEQEKVKSKETKKQQTNANK
ncbi:centromere kinetochore component CENP-T-domain-containing protein [Lipomyces chichibuensis]|uniref:centromere kinetochore component CENP-T-domain-containing protein n=1 Tax=Lipomyces chichibuensis TaxID=1546026 RepID=UPI003343376C